jgi:cellulose synthase/poly-beta-1,6-N-acetylglucosamine synthase-like glycosyltransferase
MAIRLICATAVVVTLAFACAMYGRLALIWGIMGAAVFCMTLGAAETYWRAYCWWTPEIMDRFRWADAVEPGNAKMAFSIVLAALDEVPSLAPTLELLAKQDHPNYEIVVALCSCDGATITEARRVEALHSGRIRLAIRPHRGRHRKAYQLNEAIMTLAPDKNRVVVIADAEGGMHPQVLRYFEAQFVRTGADVVQGGVQLMNLGDGLATWFQAFAAMEYKAWFEGNMARQANNGVVLLGGNTIAFTLAHLEAMGGIPDSLTEDGVAGIMTALVGGTVAVAYSPELCTRELSPPTVFNKRKGSLFFQRVRWVHGYIEELLRGRWWRLPTWRQRRSAGYGLASPVLQAISSILIPVAIASAIFAKIPIGLSTLTFAPLVPYMLVVVAQLMHLADFGRRFEHKVSVWHYLTIIFLAPIYQMILIGAAAVAIWRQVAGKGDWYRTGREHDEKVAASIAVEGVAA